MIALAAIELIISVWATVLLCNARYHCYRSSEVHMLIYDIINSLTHQKPTQTQPIATLSV